MVLRMKKVYLDVCCLNRPFDDQEQERIHLESEAIRLILKRIGKCDLIWVGSSVLNLEINKTPDIERKANVIAFMDGITDKIYATEKDVDRARVFESLGFKAMDALHLACAERLQVDVFLTVDDKLISKGKMNPGNPNIRIENPVTWLQEVIK